MGLSFHDESSLIEAAGSLRFAPYDPYPTPGVRGINQENDTDCENDDIQMLERRSVSETIDKSMELKDSCIVHEGDLVDSMPVVDSPSP